MRISLSYGLLAAGLLFLGTPDTASAQCYESDGELTYEVACPDSGSDPVGEALNPGVTKGIVKLLKGASDTCGSELIDPRYRIDCLRIYYLKVAESLPDRGDYVPVKKAMLAAADKLDAIVEGNLDESAPKIRPREGHKPAAKRLPAVRPVKEEMVDIALAQAAEVVEQTELVILRSGGDPARRTKHYTEVAAAVEDNLVILRSA